MIADFELQCDMALDHSWKFMAASISRFLHNFFKMNGNVEMDVVRESFLNRINLLWADICKEHHIRQLTTPQPQPPLQLQAEHYAPLVSDKVQHAIQAAPWHSTRNAAQSPAQGDAGVPVAHTNDETKEARKGDEASSAKHYATATVSALEPTRIAAAPASSPAVARIVLQHLLLVFRLRHLGHLLRLRFLVLLLCVIQSMEGCFVAIAQMRGNLIATSANYLTPTLKLWS
jgi:hypothetical protein